MENLHILQYDKKLQNKKVHRTGVDEHLQRRELCTILGAYRYHNIGIITMKKLKGRERLYS